MSEYFLLNTIMRMGKKYTFQKNSFSIKKRINFICASAQTPQCAYALFFLLHLLEKCVIPPPYKLDMQSFRLAGGSVSRIPSGSRRGKMRARSKGNWLAAFCAAFCVLTAFAAWAGDSASFVSKTVADNSSVTGGKSFKQQWTIKNTGSKTWDSDYKLRYISGDLSSSHSSIKISGKVKPGKTYTFSMEMKAPAAKDSEKAYREEWKFGKSSDSTLTKLWTQIVVPKAVPVVTDDYGNSCSAAADISLNSSKNGKIDFAGDNDFFRIQVSSKGTLKVYTTGDTDTYGRLFDSNCNEIKHDDDDGKGDNFSISKSVSAGTYYVAVRHHSSTKTGSYTLNVDPIGSDTLPAVNWNSLAYRDNNIFWAAGLAPKRFYPNNISRRLGNAKGNCTWYAHGRLKELGYDAKKLNLMSGNARDWKKQAAAGGVSVSSTPKQGDIAQATAYYGIYKEYGHVAVVEKVNSDGTLLISESSYAPNSATWNFEYRTRTVSRSEFNNYIHVPKP